MSKQKGAGLRMRREQAIPSEKGRRCAHCGDFIDPIDWCPYCREKQAPCDAHPRLRKRADAAYCDSGCRSARRSTYIRDCL